MDLGSAISLTVVMGFFFYPMWEDRQKRLREEASARRKREMDIAILHATQGRSGLERKLLADLKQVHLMRECREDPEAFRRRIEALGPRRAGRAPTRHPEE